jgi:ParB family chromosome partitioning protein
VNLSTVKREFLDVPLGLIDEPVLPSRSGMDEEKLDELTANIRLNGLIQPIALARTGERFEVIAGHRRTIASKRAGLVAVPAIVYPSKTAALEAVKFGENRHREDLNPADEAIYFSELLEHECGGDTDKLCELVGERRAYVEGRLLLFTGDEKVFEQLQAGKIAIGVAHQLNKCDEQLYRRMLLHQAIIGGATVGVVSGWILDWKKQQGYTVGAAPVGEGNSDPGPVPTTNYFVCKVCGGSEDVHLMRPINVHTHCERAVLDKMLAAYRGEA